MIKLTPGAEAVLRERPDLREYLEKNPFPKWSKPKPKPQIMGEPVNPQTIANAAARPDKVRIVTETDAGVPMIDRLRRTEVVRDVLEVDAQGRPKLVETYDPETNSRGTAEFNQGYSPKGGVVHSYNPLDALKEPER